MRLGRKKHVVALACALGVCSAAGLFDASARDERIVVTGIASVYGDRLQGRATASGEPYDRDALTAAHRTLPLGSRARVTNLENNKSVVVRINDRGPQTAGRILDLSRSAAERLGVRTGVVRVRVEVISLPPN